MNEEHGTRRDVSRVARRRRDWALTTAQKLEAREAFEVLDGTGISLVDAAHAAVARAGKVEAVHTLDDAVGAFLRWNRDRGLRGSTLEWYARELSRFAEAFPARRIDQVRRLEVRQYLDTRQAGAKAPAFRCVRALFRFALRQEPPWLVEDPTRGIKVENPARDFEISRITPEQAAKLLAGAGDYRSAFALALFAGIRPEEIAGRDKPPLTWAHVNTVERIIRVPAEIAKTRVPRVLEGLPEAVWCWLEPAGPREPIAPGNFRQAVRLGRDLLGLDRWPKDVTRHSFASYATALLGDAARVALWLGHEGDQRILHRHYRGVVTEADAKRFFGLRPGAAEPGNVVVGQF